MPIVVGALASHVDSSERSRRLLRCLRSVANQFPDPVILYMSWSAATPDLTETAQKAIDSVRLPSWKVVRSVEPLTQFQHYRRCEQLISGDYTDDSDVWVIFSDDDDIWCSTRHIVYKTNISEVPPQVTACVADIHLSGDCNADNLEDIDDDSVCKIHKQKEHGTHEYWKYAVRLTLFSDFFKWASTRLLKLVFCDMTFASFIATYRLTECCQTATMLLPTQTWMYFQDKSLTGRASTRQFEVTPFHKASASRVHAEVGSIHGGSVDDTSFVAALADVDRLVQLFCCRYYFRIRSAEESRNVVKTFADWLDSRDVNIDRLVGLVATRDMDLFTRNFEAMGLSLPRAAKRRLDEALHEEITERKTSWKNEATELNGSGAALGCQ